jgi:hypothetical protein
MARFLEFFAMESVRATEATSFTDGWDVWSGFIVEVMTPAMIADSLASTHAVVVVERRVDGGREGLEEEERELESVIESFDTITYGKGAFLIRMLSLLVGVKVFTKAIARLVHVHQFKNTSRFDLWDAFEHMVQQEHSDKTKKENKEDSGMLIDGLSSNTSLRDVMESWLLQPGFPELRVQLHDGAHVAKAPNDDEEPLENEYPSEGTSSESDSESVVSACSSTSSNVAVDATESPGKTLIISQTPYGTSEKTRGAHWIIPVSVRFAYVGREAHTDNKVENSSEAENVRVVVLASVEQVHWMEAGVTQLGVDVPSFEDISDGKSFSGPEPRLCLLVNCHALAFLHVHYVGAATWAAVLGSMEVPGAMSQVEKICLVQNEIVAYVHADLPDRPVSLSRMHEFSSKLSLADQAECIHPNQTHSVGQMPSCTCKSSASTARITLLEFLWGLKVYSMTKFVERARESMQKSVNGSDSVSSTSSGTSSGSFVVSTMVVVATSSTHPTQEAAKGKHQQKAITAPDILHAVELAERLYREIDAEIRSKGATPWVVESCMIIRGEVTELSRVLWQLAAKSMYTAAVPQKTVFPEQRKRFSSCVSSVAANSSEEQSNPVFSAAADEGTLD